MPSVLVIEDDDLLREGLVTAFELDGYHTTSEADGEAALSAAKASPPDLIICDHILRSMDGLNLLHAVRSQAQLADVPFVVISVQRSRSFRKTCRLAGANEVFGKPFDVSDLLGSARRLLGQAARPPVLASRR